jgi:hypothetical protein
MKMGGNSMKEVWICRWEVIPGNGEQTEQFPNLAAAKQAMRLKIADCIDLQDYIADLEPQVAAFLGRYLSDPQFPQSKNEIPEDYEDPEYGELYLGVGAINWEFPYDAYPRLHTNMVLDSTENEDCRFDFWYECPEEAIGSGVKALSISISPHMDYGPSAYPLMICEVLDGTPKTQTVIIQAIQEKYGTKIDRKAVSRHLELLGALGFRVRKGKDGYYLGEAI